MSEKVTQFISQYDGARIEKFILDAFGKYRYVHTLSDHGVDYYLSNLRDVYQSHPDDVGCVAFYIKIISKRDGTEWVNLYHLVDFRDPDAFIDTVKRYLNLKAFL